MSLPKTLFLSRGSNAVNSARGRILYNFSGNACEGYTSDFRQVSELEVGEGKMTLVESKPAELVRIEVAFVKPFEGASTSEFTFRPQDGGTEVVWASYGPMNFISKAICLVMNMEKTLGPEMEKGLMQMKTVAESGRT